MEGGSEGRDWLNSFANERDLRWVCGEIDIKDETVIFRGKKVVIRWSYGILKENQNKHTKRGERMRKEKGGE